MLSLLILLKDITIYPSTLQKIRAYAQRNTLEKVFKLSYFWNTKTDIDQGIHKGKGKIVARNEKCYKLYEFLYSKIIVNFEAFRWNISSSMMFLFL